MLFRWVNPWMLAALAGASIPIIIEWLFRRRRRRVELPTIRFLLKTKVHKKVRLQDRILLIVRTVVLVLLAVLLARPILRPTGGETLGAARRALIVLDGTYSMAQSVGHADAFTVARERAAEILRGLPKGMPVAVVSLGAEPRVLKDFDADRGAVERALDGARVSDGAGRMPDAIEMARQLIQAAGDEAVETYIISDLQRVTWAPTPDDPREGLALAAELAGRGRVFILDTGAGETANAFLTRLEPTEATMAVGCASRFEVDVRVVNMPADRTLRLTLSAERSEGQRSSPPGGDPSGTGRPEGASARGSLEPSETGQSRGTLVARVSGTAAVPDTLIRRAPAQVGSDNRKIQTRELTAADFVSGQATVIFDHVFLEPGEYLVRAEIEGDALAADNRRYYLATVPAAVETLVLDPACPDEPPPGRPVSAGGWLKLALAPDLPPGFDRVTPFAVDVRRPEDAFHLNLGDYAAVMLAGLPDPSDALVSRLEEYVGDGGRLVIFAGEGIDTYAYNRKLLKGGQGLLPCELLGAAKAAEASSAGSPSPAPGEGGDEGASARGSLEPLERVPGTLTQDSLPGRQRDTTSRPAVEVHPLGLAYAGGAFPLHPAVARVRQLVRHAPSPTVLRYVPVRLANRADRFGEAIAVLTNGDPAICERRFGQGRVCFVTTTADDAWNRLVFTNEYPVLMQELLRWLVGDPDEGVNLQQGEPFTQPVLLSGQHLLLRRPDYERVRLTPVKDPGGDIWRVICDRTDRQGLYVVDAPREVLTRRRFVVNLRAAEGDLTRLDAAEAGRLPAGRQAGAASGVTLWAAGTPIRQRVAARHSVRELAAAFAWGLFALLAVETLLAMRFGRRRIGTTATQAAPAPNALRRGGA